MNPLSSIYGAAVGLRNWLYDAGVARAAQLTRPVVSVGNLNAGGSGKTPLVIELGRLLQERGLAFDILSRGYRRQSDETLIVTPETNVLKAGDEPLLIARKLRAPVVVSPLRCEAGQLAERKLDSRLHLLDDGFQHRQLARDFNIVILTERDLSDTLLPIGRLREPLPSLHRADAVVIGEEVDEQKVLALFAQLFPHGGEPYLWRKRRRLRLPAELAPSVVAFCAIAHPQKFFAQLRESGANVVAEKKFRDHHLFTREDLDELRRIARRAGAQGFVATEKDAMKLELHEPLEGLAIAPLECELLDADKVMETLLRALSERRPECGVYTVDS